MKKVLLISLIAFVFADIGYSFLQHYYTPFDGDMAGGIVPSDDVKLILESPLGLKVFKENITYPNPNKFFCHWTFFTYFNNAPLFFGKFTTPINSAYISCAFAKTVIQVVLLFLIALYISGSLFKSNFLLAVVLITPLFQTNGYRKYMGIIDTSTTYTFFYALPFILVLIYFAPLFLKYFHGCNWKNFKYFKYLWIPLALISSLSGPLNPGISLVISLLIVIHTVLFNYTNSNITNKLIKLKKAIQNIPKDIYFYLTPICLFSIYSLYLGRFNSVNLGNELPLHVLYSRLPEGLIFIITRKLGFPVLFLTLIINVIIIRKSAKVLQGKRLLALFKWIGIFSLIYILLLPLGGYRAYRPYILRYDTLIPITVCLMLIIGMTTIFIFNILTKKKLYWYISLITIVMLVFIYADEPKFNKNICEKNAITQIANSKDKIVEIDNECTVLSWTIIKNPDESRLNASLLKLWKIIEADKLYYQR